jgi:hypothetical protein
MTYHVADDDQFLIGIFFGRSCLLFIVVSPKLRVVYCCFCEAVCCLLLFLLLGLFKPFKRRKLTQFISFNVLKGVTGSDGGTLGGVLRLYAV